MSPLRNLDFSITMPGTGPTGNLVKYVLARGAGLPPYTANLYEYVFAGNGVFVRADREGLGALVPAARMAIRGLADVEPYCQLGYPPLPPGAVETMIDISQSVCTNGGVLECLFHLVWAGNEWQLVVPPQERSAGSVRPTETGPGTSYADSIIEVHSHHKMAAFFSGTDDRDEQGFKLYGVLGNIFDRPVLRLRVGVYGYFYEIPASTAFVLPEGMIDLPASEYDFPVFDEDDVTKPEADPYEVSAGEIDEETGLWIPSR